MPPVSPSLWVNTLQGTDSHYHFSTGNTLPLATRPHGMVGWTPQTDEGAWAFDLRSPTIQGFRATHRPSPWVGDYGNFTILVASGAEPPRSVIEAESYYPKAETIAHPHYFRTRLIRHGIRAEVTPTERGGQIRLTYSWGEHAWLSFKPAAGAVRSLDPAGRRITGVSTACFAGAPAHFGCHFVAELNCPWVAAETFSCATSHPIAGGQATGAWLRLLPPPDGIVIVRVATSFISLEQAKVNLERELHGRSFDAAVAEAQADWDARLSVIRIRGATDDDHRTFYGALFRALLFPRIWHEFDRDGRRIHFSPYDGQVHPGPLYTDCGFWDVHRSLLPLLSLIAPSQLGEMIQGWVHTYREGGWLPNWAAPGYVQCMVGSHAGLNIVDAYLKGIRNFDVAEAYAAVLRDATVEPPDLTRGRPGLRDYARLGWIAADHYRHSVARTCDYAMADFAVAQFAGALGHAEVAARFRQRALNYRHLYDPAVGFLRGRNSDGTWREPFREFAWNNDYIEGSAWQHTWSAPHDPAGLIALMGGDQAFVEKLDRLLTQPPRYETGRYPSTIHEMNEMAAAAFGQYAHSNQPVHHVLCLYACAGRPDRMQHYVRRVLRELYSPLHFPGDEDNGSMGSWYVLQALGIYPLTPGHPAWVLGAPLFDEAVIRLESGGEFTIRAVGQAPESCYVREVALNGQPHRHLELPHAAITAGGELFFALTRDAAVARRRGELPRPYSLTPYPARPG